jgi:hypothetical protein
MKKDLNIFLAKPLHCCHSFRPINGTAMNSDGFNLFLIHCRLASANG